MQQLGGARGIGAQRITEQGELAGGDLLEVGGPGASSVSTVSSAAVLQVAGAGSPASWPKRLKRSSSGGARGRSAVEAASDVDDGPAEVEVGGAAGAKVGAVRGFAASEEPAEPPRYPGPTWGSCFLE